MINDEWLVAFVHQLWVFSVGLRWHLITGLEKSGRIVAFCDWNARFCDQETWCSRNFAPKNRKPGASLRPDEHSSRSDYENKNEKRLSFPTRTKESDVTWVLQAACDCSWESNENCRLAQRSADLACGMAANPLRLALTDPSIDRRSYMQPDVR